MKSRSKEGRFIEGVHYSPETEFKKGTHWRESKPYWNKDFLEDLYINQKKSSQEISDLFKPLGTYL